MAGCVNEENGGGRSSEVISTGQRCQPGDSLSEWRSCEQVENGTPSTSPPYWDTDEDDEFGPKPSELYGKFTWKIENFSQINKRELRSNAFEVGGYKWYILVYPQGCDVCNHLSLFLCVANHDKLLPGWSHFAQFTIAVVNKDPKKSKYSDTLHRFWKKEHDWGWKKFMELSKVFDGFIVGDTLVIKAQVQVIREKSDRPFRCLDCQYRRELVRVYLTNVEGICRRFVEERRTKLGKLIEDKPRWSSFCAFWLGMDQNTRRRMSREKNDTILKHVVKQFFIEKEVTSTLVMDSLYSGLKAVESQSSNQKLRANLTELEESSPPIVRVEMDMFVLTDDVLELLEWAAGETLPPLKDDKGPQNRTKEGNSGENFNKDSIECDERRLSALGQKTMEIFVVTQIYSNKIEVAYQEAVALKRQEELIREEEASWQAGNNLKSKRGAADKEKRAKKKQAKQKRSNRKKDKAKDEKLSTSLHDKHRRERLLEERAEDLSLKEQSLLVKCDPQEGDVSGVSDAGEDTTEACPPDLEDRDSSPVNWDTDASEVHPPTEASRSAMGIHPLENGKAKKMNRASMDDSSSTCSTDSIPSVVNGPHRKQSLPRNCSQRTSYRRKNESDKENNDQNAWIHDTDSQSLDSLPDSVLVCDADSNCDIIGPEPDSIRPLKDRFQWSEQHIVEKEVVSQRRMSSQDHVDLDRPSKQSCEPLDEIPSSSASSPVTMSISTSTTELNSLTLAESVSVRSSSANSPTENPMLLLTESPHSFPSISQPDFQKSISTIKFPSQHGTSTKSTIADTQSTVSRPSSAPIVAGPRPTTPAITMGQLSPSFACSASAAGRLTTSVDQLPSTSFGIAYQSYKNAIMSINKWKNSGIPRYASPHYSIANAAPYSPALSSALPLSSPASSTAASPQSTGTASLLSHSVFARESSNCAEASGYPDFTFGTVTPGILHKPHQSGLLEEPNSISWVDRRALEKGGNSLLCEPYFQKNRPNLDSRHVGLLDSQDEFPHLDIINYLLDEEHVIGKTTTASGMRQNSGHVFSRQFAFPVMQSVGRGSDVGMMATVGSSGCRLESSVGYPEDSLQHTYGSRVAPYDARREVYDMVMSPYMLQQTEQQDRFLSSNQQGQRQWSADSANSSSNSEMLPMPISDYGNLGHVNGLNEYVAFKPASGR
ncbi:unnamed protein product [Victoria cruziana]